MSLINQMLKDLEGRQQTAPLKQAQPVLRPRPAAPWRKLLLLGGLIAMLLVAAAIWRFAGQKSRSLPPVGKLPAAVNAERTPDTLKRPAVEPPAVSAPVSQTEPAVSLPDTVSLQTIRLREIDNFIHFEADFDRPPVYHVALASDRRSLLVDLTAAELAAELPSAASYRRFKGLRVRQKGDRLTLQLLLSPACKVRDYSATMQVAGAGYRLLLDLYPEAPQGATEAESHRAAAFQDADAGAEKGGVLAATAAAPAESPAPGEVVAEASAEPLVRTVREPSPQERAEQAYHSAMVALGAGHSQQAVEALALALRQHPAHLAARQALVTELLKQRRTVEAETVLAEGLRLHPDHLPLRLRYADLLLAQGAAEKARDLLLDGPQPSPVEAPELHGLLGALYQRLGQYPAAAREYQALLAIQPDNGLWLMGLAIAQEHAGNRTQAVSAYQAALEAQGLSPALNSYVRQRLAALRP